MRHSLQLDGPHVASPFISWSLAHDQGSRARGRFARWADGRDQRCKAQEGKMITRWGLVESTTVIRYLKYHGVLYHKRVNTNVSRGVCYSSSLVDA